MRTERPTHEYRKLGALLGLGTCVIALLTYEMCISTQVGSAPGQSAQVMAAGSRIPEITALRVERQRNARVVLQGTNGNKDSTAVDRKKLADMVAVMKRLTVIKTVLRMAPIVYVVVMACTGLQLSADTRAKNLSIAIIRHSISDQAAQLRF